MKKEMTKLTIKVYDSQDAEKEMRNLKRLGYTRTQNAYWVEYWVKGERMVILERDF